MQIITDLFTAFFPLMIILFIVQLISWSLGIDLFGLGNLLGTGTKTSRSSSNNYEDDVMPIENEPSQKYLNNYSKTCFKCGEARLSGEKYCNQCGWEFE